MNEEWKVVRIETDTWTITDTYTKTTNHEEEGDWAYDIELHGELGKVFVVGRDIGLINQLPLEEEPDTDIIVVKLDADDLSYELATRYTNSQYTWEARTFDIEGKPGPLELFIDDVSGDLLVGSNIMNHASSEPLRVLLLKYNESTLGSPTNVTHVQGEPIQMDFDDGNNFVYFVGRAKNTSNSSAVEPTVFKFDID